MTRIIVWSIVGVLALAFIIFVLPTIRQERRYQQAQQRYAKEQVVTDEQAYQEYIERCEHDAEKFARQIEKRRERLTNPTPAQSDLISKLEEKYTEFARIVSELKDKTTREDREQAFNTLRDLKRDIRLMIRQLGGKTARLSAEEAGESDE